MTLNAAIPWFQRQDYYGVVLLSDRNRQFSVQQGATLDALVPQSSGVADVSKLYLTDSSAAVIKGSYRLLIRGESPGVRQTVENLTETLIRATLSGNLSGLAFLLQHGTRYAVLQYETAQNAVIVSHIVYKDEQLSRREVMRVGPYRPAEAFILSNLHDGVFIAQAEDRSFFNLQEAVMEAEKVHSAYLADERDSNIGGREIVIISNRGIERIEGITLKPQNPGYLWIELHNFSAWVQGQMQPSGKPYELRAVTKEGFDRIRRTHKKLPLGIDPTRCAYIYYEDLDELEAANDVRAGISAIVFLREGRDTVLYDHLGHYATMTILLDYAPQPVINVKKGDLTHSIREVE
ncbi:hypothetical protein JW930_02030 [Candidatus Woesearchaeota archaeon]|nr:hypothetical protein [Candidatus Woesearchaeota archaeon]